MAFLAFLDPKVDALPHGWTYRPDRWLKMTLVTSSTKYEPKFFLPLTTLEHCHFIWLAQNSHFLGLLNIKMMKMDKREPRRALTVLKPSGNAFSAQKTYMGSILDWKTSNFGWKCPKMAFFGHFGPKISKFKVDALPHWWTYRPGRWLKMILVTSSTK